MFDLLIIGFVALSVTAFVATKDKKDTPEKPIQATEED